MEKSLCFSTNSSSGGENSHENDDVLLSDERTVDSDGRTLLHRCCAEGKAELAAKILSRGAYCDVEDTQFETPLCLAAKGGHYSLIDLLLDAGADVDHLDSEGWCSLRSAAWAGHFDCLERLLMKGEAALLCVKPKQDGQVEYANLGATVDLCNTSKRTALRTAAWSGNESCVVSLLTHGAEVDKTDIDGRTPLMAAAYMGRKEIVELLLQKGADPNHKDMEKRAALHVAAVCGVKPVSADHLGVADALIRNGGRVDEPDGKGRSALLLACLEGNLSAADLLLTSGADRDLADCQKVTPLLAACATGHAALVSLLLKAGAHCDSVDNEGRTALTVAAAQGDPGVLSVLLKWGLDEVHKDNFGWLPLHHAAFEGNPQACKILLSHNPATISQCDVDGRHALILAAEEGHTDTVEALLDCGAPINRTTLDGKSAFRLAAAVDRLQVCQLLADKGADVNSRDIDGMSALFAAVVERKDVSQLLSLGCRADVSDNAGRSALHAAVWQGDVALCDTLLASCTVCIDAADDEGRTALMTALWRGHVDAAAALLDLGANVNAVCLQGATALSIAAQVGLESAVRLLVRKGANKRHKDIYGRTAREVAIDAEHQHIAALLDQTNTLSPPVMRCKTSSSSGHSSSNQSKSTSGYVSSNGRLGGATVTNSGVNVASLGSTRSGATTLSANSNCDSPEAEQFARQLMERSLPRRHSQLFMQNFSLQPCDNVVTSNTQLSETEDEKRQRSYARRPKIATNPNCRSPIVTTPTSLLATPSPTKENTNTQQIDDASVLNCLLLQQKESRL